MRPKVTYPQAAAQRRIGRKVLQADRLARAVQASKPKSVKALRKLPTLQRKQVIISSAVVALALFVSIGGSRMYLAQAAETQKAAAIEQQRELKAKSASADACRRAKAEKKADQIGKVTYDELYDYGECDD